MSTGSPLNRALASSLATIDGEGFVRIVRRRLSWTMHV
jgi:hypothetical protein